MGNPIKIYNIKTNRMKLKWLNFTMSSLLKGGTIKSLNLKCLKGYIDKHTNMHISFHATQLKPTQVSLNFNKLGLAKWILLHRLAPSRAMSPITSNNQVFPQNLFCLLLPYLLLNINQITLSHPCVCIIINTNCNRQSSSKEIIMWGTFLLLYCRHRISRLFQRN